MKGSLLILGGGIIGLGCAFEAARRGAAVTLIEPGPLGGQASGAAAGMLAPFSENTERADAFFHLCAESLRLYPDWLRAIEEASGERVEWTRSGSLNLAFHEADAEPLRGRMLWQNRFGAGAELLDAAELRRLEPRLGPAAAAAIRYPGESHVYAPGLVGALERACRRVGVELLDHAGAILDLELPADGSGARAITGERGARSADRLLVSAGAWSGGYADRLGCPVPVHPIRGQICAFEAPFGEVRHMVFSPQAYWASKRNGTIVCGASEDVAGFDTAVTERGIGRLTRHSPRVFPFLADAKIVSRWAGLRPATTDGRPLLGTVPARPQAVLAAGHYRNGILLSPVTAQIACDLLQGNRTGAELAAFAPDRFAGAAAAGGVRHGG